jgi:hypothetical protein
VDAIRDNPAGPAAPPHWARARLLLPALDDVGHGARDADGTLAQPHRIPPSNLYGSEQLLSRSAKRYLLAR